MNGFDIILGIPLLYAAYRGFREGIIVQLGGIAGLFIGVYFAFRHSSAVGQWLHTDPPIAAAVGFVVILLAVLLVMALLGHLIKGIFKLAGLGPIDAIGGILLGVFKMAVIQPVAICVRNRQQHDPMGRKRPLHRSRALQAGTEHDRAAFPVPRPDEKQNNRQ